MSALDRQIQTARRRLMTDVFAQRLSVGVLVAAGLWTAVILVTRAFALPLPLGHGAWIAAILAALVGGIGTALSRPSLLRAAVALDTAAGLKERLSTALTVRQSPDEFARAAVRDAEGVAAKVHVPTHLPHRAPVLWPWSAATVAVALVLLRFMPTLDLLAGQKKPEPIVPLAEVQAEQRAIQTEFEERAAKLRELAKENPNLKDISEALEPLELPETPGVTPEDVRREAVKRIDDVGDRLKRELAATEHNALGEMKRLLNQLQPQGGDRAEAKLSQALAAGDFEGAKQAMQKLRDELQQAAQQAPDPETQQKLAEMSEQLTKLADQVAKLSDTTQLQKELQNKGGLSEEDAKKLLDQLSKMDPKQLQKELQKQLGGKGLSEKQLQQIAQKIQQSKQARQACQKLAQSLAKAAQAAQQCNNPGSANSSASQASNALSDAAGQLSDMEMAEQMMNELQAQLSDLDNLRDSVCQGNCRRPGDGQARGIGQQGPNYGRGLGERIGKEKVAYDVDPTKAKTRFQGGTITGQMLVDGPQVRGAASAEVLTAAESQVRDALDAIEHEEVPRQYRKVLQEYFERLAGLVRDKQDAEPGETAAPAEKKAPESED
ncbi:MAG: hypothetical protein KA383_06015 [Phycisphaerae bacterium]|nr:hypothetical protein [Phycisphaerae bacterium]